MKNPHSSVLLRTYASCLLASIALSPAYAAEFVKAAKGVEILPIEKEAWAGSSVNMISGLQNSITTHGDTQYAIFYNSDRQVVLARRTLGSDRWEARATKLSGRVQDAHNTAVVAVDGSGILHVAWDHHGNPLNYVTSVAPGSLELGEPKSMTGSLEDNVTYPSFLNLPNGDLLFMYRSGSSGSGDLVVNRFDNQARVWRRMRDKLIDGEGERNAYVSTYLDTGGTLHMAWVWRETPDVATNHDLCYAYSNDSGETWFNVDGGALEMPITIDSPVYALRIQQNHSLMNAPTVTADESGSPIIVNYWAAEERGIPQYRIVYRDGSEWKTQQVTQRQTPFHLSGTATKRPPLSRSIAVARNGDDDGRGVFVVYRDDDHASRVVVSRCDDLAKRQWDTMELTASSVGAWEPSLDVVQWQRNAELHLLVQRVEQKDGDDREAVDQGGTGIGALVWRPLDDPSAQVNSEEKR